MDLYTQWTLKRKVRGLWVALAEPKLGAQCLLKGGDREH